jgi:hypothetical protein
VTVAAAAAIVALNWPHESRRPQIVEPGLIADQPSKLMAPSAALARVPPREEPNVAGERPRVRQTRDGQVEEMLSFKPGSATASGAPPDARVPQPLLPSAPEKAASAPAALAPAPTPVRAAASEPKPLEIASLPPTAAPSASATLARPPVEGAPEPGLGEAAKIEARLADLEAAIKARANAPATRTDIDTAETQMSDQVARLAALVTRLTGQVKDLQDQVRTASTGSDDRFADLTRRVSLAESRSAVAAAESAGAAPAGVPTSGAPAAAPSSGAAGQAQGVRMKVAALDQKRAYRIQAASPGLAMLSVVDGAPDDRPVEVAIGTVLPGYGKVISIEQHGQAWVVKADRGSIQ